MKSACAGCAGTTAVLALTLIVLGHTLGQAQPPSRQPTARQQVTITGCVQREADYRRAQNLGRGGAAASGAGVGNEFVIINASTSTTAASATAAREPVPPPPPAATGAAGTSREAYETTGSGEGQLEQYAGKRVEVTGTVKPLEKTGGKPAGGIDATGQDLNLPELEITTVRGAPGECPKQ